MLRFARVIRSIVFDIGWVFVNLNPAPILKCLAEHECDVRELHVLVNRIGLADHETGRIDAAAGSWSRWPRSAAARWRSTWRTPAGSTCSSCSRAWSISRIA